MPGQYNIPTQDEELFDLGLPSGGTVQVRRLSIEDLVALDILDQMDTLGSIVQEDHVDRVKGTNKKTDRPKKKPTKAEAAAKADEDGVKMMQGLMKDREKWAALSATIDRVFVEAVVQPKTRLAYDPVTVTPEGGEPKEIWVKHDPTRRATREQAIWTDTIGLEDKMHVFGSVLPGQEKMAPFRPGSAEAVGDLGDGGEAGDDAS